jgi:antitoxin (DNA-binding transcriptional repressor) of toxin-antitoxin stability system
MDASVVDLRYKTREILQALDRRESVNILYHGKLKATIVPAPTNGSKDFSRHPFFGSAAKDTRKVAEIMQDLRGGRYRAL